jgi:DNA recombination protein RmuC
MDSSLPATLITLLAGAVAGALVAAVVVHLGWSRRAAESRLAESARTDELRDRLARAEAAVRTDEQLLDAYRSVSSTTLQEQSEQLLQLAATRYQTLETTALSHWQAQGESVTQRLEQYAARIQELEAQRRSESAVLSAAVDGLRRSNEEIRAEAHHLSTALRDNKVRGVWGEMQLRRVLEQAGMSAHADFVEQRHVGGADGTGRPDVIVRLPNGRCVVIDAKAPLDRYLAAGNCDDPVERDACVADHAKAVAGHVNALARRRYEDLVGGAVDFVVMFVPGDAFLSAAFEARPGLLEEAFGQHVILASPSTLLGFLRGVALGWRERQVAEQAETIAALGRELHERVTVFADHMGKVGGSLTRAVGAYNDAVGSLERRVLVSARRFEELGAGSSRELPSVDPVEAAPRVISLPELSA